MSGFIVNFTFGGETGTVPADGGFSYTDKLNELNEAQVKLIGSGSTIRSLFRLGAEVEIKRNGTREFFGVVVFIDTLDAGGIIADVRGYEWWLKEKGEYANSPWKATASATIFTDILAESTKLTAGTIDTGISMDFRAGLTDSFWNSLSNLARKTGQDVQVDYPNLEIDILDHRGSSTSVLVFNDGIEIRNLRFSQGYPIGNDVRVYGKGDGVNQIKSAVTSGQDAASKTTYGTIRHIVPDRTVMSQSEADTLADAIVPTTKDPTKIYDFDVINPSQSLIAGDLITLNSADKDLTNEEVRITGIQRGMIGGREFLTMQVANAAYSRLILERNSILNKLKKQQRDSDTFMQGSGNTQTWTNALNAKSGAAMRIVFPVAKSFVEDEAGNLRVESLTLDYDVDPYRAEYGTATMTGSDPQVQNQSGSATPLVVGLTGSAPMDIANIFNNDANNGGSPWNVGYNLAVLDGPPGELGDAGDEREYFRVNIAVRADYAGTGNDWFGVRWRFDKDGTFETKLLIHASEHFKGDGSIFLEQWFYIPYTDNSRISPGNLQSENILQEDLGWTLDFYTLFGLEYTIYCKVELVDWLHFHDDGNLQAASHPHTDGTYDINAADIDPITIGDDVSDAGALVASNVTIKLDYWNTGTSAWDNKVTIIPIPASLLDTDVDLTDGGTYPDVTGLWRVTIEPNGVTPDLVQGIVKMKHSLDN